MLATIGLQRGHDVYIANAVKCRPPNNRTPEADELAACFPSAPADRADPAAPDRRPRPPGGPGPAEPGGQDLGRPGQDLPLRRHPGGGHLPPGLPAAQPARQGESLGRPVFCP
jgi:hypothetical protein